MKRKEAHLLGITKYPADNPCSSCGTFERYTNGGRCVQCAINRYQVASSARQILPPESVPATREAALAIGSKYYKTGLPCSNGHLAKRDTRYGYCVMCHRQRALRSVNRVTASQAKRASGLVKVEFWCYPHQLQEAKAFEMALLNKGAAPVTPPAHVMRYPVPQLPRSALDDIDLR